jgi:putative two-component system response regulator
MKTIFVVDDNGTNLVAAKQALQETYKVMAILSAAQMFKLLEKITPDLILLDIDMPDMDGFTAIAELKKSAELRGIPVIFLTANSDDDLEVKGFELGAVDYVNKPFSKPILLKRLEMHLNVDSLVKERTAKIEEHIAKIERLRNGIVTVVADIIEGRDKVTGGHIQRTAEYLRILLEAMARSGVYSDIIVGWDFKVVIPSAKLHDLGKIAVSDVVLNKPGKLTDDEFTAIKRHSAEGEKLVDQIAAEIDDEGEDFLRHARLFAGTHHEKWNGTGYPKGLSGEEIPLEGRIMAIADVYDALTNERPYKKAFSHEEAVEIITKDSGAAFDPALAEVFLEVAEDFCAYSMVSKNAEYSKGSLNP